MQRKVQSNKSEKTKDSKKSIKKQTKMISPTLAKQLLAVLFLYLMISQPELTPLLLVAAVPFAGRDGQIKFAKHGVKFTSENVRSSIPAICRDSSIPTANKPNVTLGMTNNGELVLENCKLGKEDACNEDRKIVNDYSKPLGVIPYEIQLLRNTATREFRKFEKMIKEEAAAVYANLDNAKEQAIFRNSLLITKIWAMRTITAKHALKLGTAACGEYTPIQETEIIAYALKTGKNIVMYEVDVSQAPNQNNPIDAHVFPIVNAKPDLKSMNPGIDIDDELTNFIPRNTKLTGKVLNSVAMSDAEVCDGWNKGHYGKLKDDKTGFYSQEAHWSRIRVERIATMIPDFDKLPQEAVNFFCAKLEDIGFAAFFKPCNKDKKTEEVQSGITNERKNIL